MRLLAGLILTTALCWGQGGISYDNGTDGGQVGSFPATQAYNVTVGSCPNRLLVVSVATLFGSAPTAALGSTALSLLGYFSNPNSSSYYLTVLYLKAPAAGTSLLTITNTGGGSQIIDSQEVSYCGVNQTAPIDVNNTGAVISGTLTISATTTVNNDWGITLVAATATVSAGTNTTQRLQNTTNGTFRMFSGDTNAPQTPAGIFSMATTVPGAPVPWGFVVFISPAAGATQKVRMILQ